MSLKRVCRANTINRWPCRTRKSLGNLIERTRQVLDHETEHDKMEKLAALQVLVKQRQLMQVQLSCSCCGVACDHGAWGLHPR